MTITTGTPRLRRFVADIGLWSPDGRIHHRRLYRALIVNWRFRGSEHGFHIRLGRTLWPHGKS